MALKKITKIISIILDTDAGEIPQADFALVELDQLQLARLVIECEKAFHVTIFDEDVHTFRTAGDIAAYIEERLDDVGLDPERALREKDGWYYR